MLLDRADGELARQSRKFSPWGHRFDLLSDSFCNAIGFFGLGLGLTSGAFGAIAPVLGAVAGLAIAAILLIVMRAEAANGPRAGEVKGVAGFDPDDALLVVPLAIWLGGAEILLAAAASGAPLAMLGFAWRFRALVFAR